MYDAIVIGSGIGGLTAAGLLAKVAGQRVLVLEKHTEPGGLTHSFSRDGATWDTGVHYIGQMAEGTTLRRYFDLLSNGELGWNPLPEPYDRFCYPGLDFPVPTGREAYIARLSALFPAEERAIRSWFRDTRRAARWLALSFVQAVVPRPLAPLIRGFQRLTRGLATSTLRSQLDARFRSEELKALLASQWGDHGLPPSQSAFANHATIVEHYLDGAWFPAGGSARIARTIEKVIEDRGGAVRVAQEVTRILVEQGRAVGVRVIDRRAPLPEEREFLAPVIISDAGAENTLTRLLPTDGAVGQATARLREHVVGLGRSTSAVSVHLELDQHPGRIGAGGGNLWIYRNHDHDSGIGDDSLLRGKPRDAFVSFSSVKSGEKRHTLEIVSFTQAAAFEHWAGRPLHNRGHDYDELKQRIAEGLISLTETVLPGLRQHICHIDVSTPLTIEHYISQPGGTCYGLPETPERLKGGPIGPATPVPGLFLTGQDVLGSGIGGALMGGVAAASQALGPRGFPSIQAALGQAPQPLSARLPEGKHLASVKRTRQLTPTVWELVLDVPGVGAFAPGQFARLEVAPTIWRDYSIVAIQGNEVRFLISTRTGRPGSRFVATTAPGTPVVVELPLGQFTSTGSDRRRVFVATGTGLSPLLPMMASGNRPDTLLFGCRFLTEDLTRLVPDHLPTTIRCITGEQVDGARPGRVTDALAELDFNPEDTEFYLCGSAAMVADASSVLARRGARFVLSEPY